MLPVGLNIDPNWRTAVQAQLGPNTAVGLKHFLTSDLKQSSTGSLPSTLSSTATSTGAHTLRGSYVLQVEDWSNIALCEEERRCNIEEETKSGTSKEMRNGAGGNSKRTLMLSLTDGVTVISALEVEPLPTNFILALRKYRVPGLKVSLSNTTTVRHGILQLSKTSLSVLGGTLVGGSGGSGGNNGGANGGGGGEGNHRGNRTRSAASAASATRAKV